jgi:DNA-binding transcriptional ArsR family regulator
MASENNDPDMFDALAHPIRRRLLMELRTGARSASELAADMPIGRPAVSEHLQVLRRAGLVHVERRGRERIHHFDPRPLAHVGGWLNLMLAHWARRVEDVESLRPEILDRP